MGARSVHKGKRFEREVANSLAAIYEAHAARVAVPAASAVAPEGTPAKAPARVVRRGLSQSRGGGAEEPDVVVGDLDLHAEVKHDNSISPAALMRQALADVRRGGTSRTLTLGVLKRDREEPTAYLFAWDALRVLGWWHGSPVVPYSLSERPYLTPGPAVRPYPGTTVHGLGKTPRDLGPIVAFPWREMLALLDAVWEHLPRKAHG